MKDFIGKTLGRLLGFKVIMKDEDIYLIAKSNRGVKNINKVLKKLKLRAEKDGIEVIEDNEPRKLEKVRMIKVVKISKE